MGLRFPSHPHERTWGWRHQHQLGVGTPRDTPGHPGTPRVSWPCFGPQGQQSEVPPWPQPFGLGAAQKCQIQPRGKGVASEGLRGALRVQGAASQGFPATPAPSQPPQAQAPRTPSPFWAPLPGGSRSPAAPGSSPGAHSERGGCGRGALRAVGALLPGQTTPRRGLPAAILSLGSAPGGSGAILCRARFLFAAHPCQRRFLPGAPTGHDGRAG